MQTNLRDRIYNLISGFMRKLVPLARRRDKVSATSLHKAEDPLYVLGCSPTAAADIVKADDRSDFSNIYPGAMPPDGSWGTYTDQNNDTYQVHPLVTSERTMNYVWDFYQSTAPDLNPEWEPLEDMFGGYTHSSQSTRGYIDGDTGFYTNLPVEPDESKEQ